MNKGFTLIELLVVVLIIGILAAIALPQYQKAVEKSRLSEALVTISNIQKGVDLWLLENGSPKEGTVQLVGWEPDVDLPVSGYCSVESKDVRRKVRVGNRWRTETVTVRTCIGGNYSYFAECTSNECHIQVIRSSDHFEGETKWMLHAIRQNDSWEKFYEDFEDSRISNSIMNDLAAQGWSEY